MQKAKEPIKKLGEDAKLKKLIWFFLQDLQDDILLNPVQSV